MSVRERPAAAEERVAAYMRESGARIIDMPLSDIARACEVSAATVVRFCRHEGYKGLKDYKIALSRRAERPEISPLTGGESLDEIRRRLTDGSVRVVAETGECLDLEQLEQAVQAIRHSGTLDIYAAGGSVPIASYLRHQLIKLGIRVSIYSDPSSMRLSYAGFARKGTVLCISATGMNEELMKAQRAAGKAGCVTVCLTANEASPLARESEIVLITAGGCFLRESSYARIAQLVVVDMLFAALYARSDELVKGGD